MRSFSIWYYVNITDEIDIKASVHVNFWSQIPYKNHKNLCFLSY